MVNNKKIILFHHHATLPNSDFILDELFKVITKYGFYDIVDRIYVGVVGDGVVWAPLLPKVEIVRINDDVTRHEFGTMKLLQDYCKENPNDIVVKSHTAGIKSGNDGTNYGDPKFPWWRYFSYHQIFIRYREYVQALKDCDAVGFEIMSDPARHFSGTHWYAHASYINTLPDVDTLHNVNFGGIPGRGATSAHACEFLIGLNPEGRLKSLIDTGYHWSQRLESVEQFIKPYLESLPKEERYWEN